MEQEVLFSTDTKHLISLIAKNGIQRSILPAFEEKGFILYNDDSLELMNRIPNDSLDMIFADSPYMLSNNGFSCQNGRMVSVNKGKWDESQGFEEDLKFHDYCLKEK